MTALIRGVLLGALLCTPAGLHAQPAQPATQDVRVPDFDAAMRGLGFDPRTTDGNGGSGSVPNGVPDADELALISAILSQPRLDLRTSRGVSFTAVRAAWLQALASATADMQALATRYPTAADVAAGYAMIGPVSFAAYNEMTTTFGAALTRDYTLARALGRFLAPDGDADGDGVSNLVEYQAQAPSGGRAAYLRAALDPSITTRSSAATASTAGATPAPGVKKVVGVVLYPGFKCSTCSARSRCGRTCRSSRWS